VSYDPEFSTAHASTGTEGNTGRAEQVAQSAKAQATSTAQVAGEELRTVADEVTTQARDLFGELRTQVGEQTGTQKQRLVEALGAFTDELKQMADAGGGSGTATELVRQLAGRAQALHTQLDTHEPSDLLDQGRGMASRRPGSFLLGALAAGVLAGRLTRGAKAASSTAPPAETAGGIPPAPQPPVDLSVAADVPRFDPSVYEPAHADTLPVAPVVPGVPPARPYSGGGAL